MNRQASWPGIALLLGAFAGLCSVFALVVTGAQAWQEHAEAHWPGLTARIEKCGVQVYTQRPEAYRIDCTISYLANGESIVSRVHSRSTPAPRRVLFSQNPAEQLDQMQSWVDAHPPGSWIGVHVDPKHPANAVLLHSTMPLSGPGTPANLKVLAFFVALSAVLVTAGVIGRSAQLRTSAN